MAMELYVFSDRQLPSMSAWQQAIDAAGFPVGLPTRFPFDWENRVLPAEFRGRATTFESGLCDAGERMAESPHIDFGRRWKHGLVLRWGSDAYAGAAAYLAGSAYAKVTGGVLLDCEEGKIISANRAAEIGFDIERSTPMIEAAVRKVIEQFRNDLSKP
jgi:hypothetical protein